MSSDPNGAELAKDGAGRATGGAAWKLGGDTSRDPKGAELAKDAAGPVPRGAASTNFDAKDSGGCLPRLSETMVLAQSKAHDGTSVGATAVDHASIGESVVGWSRYLLPTAARRSRHIHLAAERKVNGLHRAAAA